MKATGISLLFLLVSSVAFPQVFPEPMKPYRLVNDFTGLLSEQEQMDLNNKLLDFNNETSNQIYVVTWDDLQGYPIDQYAALLGDRWKIGQEGKDNGILILISLQNRELTIQVGYGLEGAVPDIIAKRLIDQVITPGFREERYYAGLDSAASVLISLTKGEYTAEEYAAKGQGEEILPVGIIILVIVLFILFSRMFRSRPGQFSTRRNIPWWILLGAGSRSGGGWGNFSSGSGGFGGFSGGGGGFGGFSGGGGGSFGGGGARGGW